MGLRRGRRPHRPRRRSRRPTRPRWVTPDVAAPSRSTRPACTRSSSPATTPTSGPTPRPSWLPSRRVAAPPRRRRARGRRDALGRRRHRRRALRDGGRDRHRRRPRAGVACGRATARSSTPPSTCAGCSGATGSPASPSIPWRFQTEAQRLEREGLPMVKVPQSPEAMTLASERLYASIVEGELTHDGDPVLTRHVARRDGEVARRAGWRLVRSDALRRRSTRRSRSRWRTSLRLAPRAGAPAFVGWSGEARLHRLRPPTSYQPAAAPCTGPRLSGWAWQRLSAPHPRARSRPLPHLRPDEPPSPSTTSAASPTAGPTIRRTYAALCARLPRRPAPRTRPG